MQNFYFLSLVMIITAVLLAFSSPAAADYTGDHPLTICDHATINGGLVFETILDGSGYTQLWAIPMEGTNTYSQDITISIPAGATVKMARLYNTYCWSKPDFGLNTGPGLPAEAELTFNGATVTCLNPLSESCTGLNPPVECRDALPNPIVYDNGVIHYWDTKGVGYETPTWWDFPSGEFAWDVSDIVKGGMVEGSGTYTATITNVDSTPTPGERFVTFGFGLLVVYEKPSSPLIDYWVAEGCDALLARTFETPENATTSATFGGVSNPIKADLTTVLTCSQGGNPTDWAASLNMIYFNGVEIGPSTAEGDMHYGVNLFDVTSLLNPDKNVVEFQDRNDCEYVHNAFLVVEYGEEPTPTPTPTPTPGPGPTGVPEFNVMGLIALIGVLSVVLAVTTIGRRRRQ